MNSFTFGLWTGFVAGFVFTALWRQGEKEPTMEEKLLGPHAAAGIAHHPDAPTSAPGSLADALARQEPGSPQRESASSGLP